MLIVFFKLHDNLKVGRSEKLSDECGSFIDRDVLTSTTSLVRLYLGLCKLV